MKLNIAVLIFLVSTMHAMQTCLPMKPASGYKINEFVGMPREIHTLILDFMIQQSDKDISAKSCKNFIRTCKTFWNYYTDQGRAKILTLFEKHHQSPFATAKALGPLFFVQYVHNIFTDAIPANCDITGRLYISYHKDINKIAIGGFDTLCEDKQVIHRYTAKYYHPDRFNPLELMAADALGM